MTEFKIQRATRQGFKPLIGLYSRSGCGKTFSALLLARGFVGPSGRIALVDTEEGRGTVYAPCPGESALPMGEYEHVPFEAPFPPRRYVQAIDFVESTGVNIGIIDSISHCWEGIGGVLEMAMENEQKSGKAGLHNWNKPKIEFASLVLRLQRSRIPWIVCIRSKEKSRQSKDERGKTVITKDEFTSPIAESGFVFEMTSYGELLSDHSFVPMKSMPPSLGECFPKQAPIELKHGEMLARWCAAPGLPSQRRQTATASPAASDMKALKSKLWEITKPIHQSERTDSPEQKESARKRLDQFLWDELILSDTESLATITNERLQQIVLKVEEKLSQTKS